MYLHPHWICGIFFYQLFGASFLFALFFFFTCQHPLEYGCQVYSSARASKLKELDVVHDAGLRICSGAFKTSPVDSLYADTEELPLDLCQEELGLRYMIKLRGSPENSIRS